MKNDKKISIRSLFESNDLSHRNRCRIAFRLVEMSLKNKRFGAAASFFTELNKLCTYDKAITTPMKHYDNYTQAQDALYNKMQIGEITYTQFKEMCPLIKLKYDREIETKVNDMLQVVRDFENSLATEKN